MSTHTEYQTIKDADGQPAFVVIPYQDFLKINLRAETLISHEVVSAMVDGATAIKAWREYMGLTQAEVSSRMGISQAALVQMESPEGRPRKATLRKVAEVLEISLEQLHI